MTKTRWKRRVLSLKRLRKPNMTEANKPDDAVTPESTEDSSNFQPTIDAHQAGASEGYGYGAHPDPGRPGGGAQAPGHVHRRHVGRHRPAPPGVRGGGQLDRRGAGRPLRRHRRHHPHRQLDQRGRQRPRHPHRREDGRQARAQALGGRDRADRAARRRQVQPEQLQGLRRPARRGRELRERAEQVAAPDGAPRRQGARTWSSSKGVPQDRLIEVRRRRRDSAR
jgi:hypothetical protein